MTTSILLVCDDEVLLRTRAAVLRSTGAEIMVSSSRSALELQEKVLCGVAIFCHSIPFEVCGRLAGTIKERWPATHTLQVLPLGGTGFDFLAPGVDQGVSCDPGLLVLRVCELVGTPPPDIPGLGSRRPYWATSEALGVPAVAQKIRPGVASRSVKPPVL